GPTGASVTGPKGVTGPTGPGGGGGLPEKLASGQSETGYWTVSSGAAPEATRLTVGTISFPIPLTTIPTKIVHLTKAQTETSVPAECESPSKVKGTLEAPQAAKGTLCVYTGQETKIGEFTEKTTNAAGVAGKVSLTGTTLTFEPKVTEPSNNIVAQGTWAVTQ